MRALVLALALLMLVATGCGGGGDEGEPAASGNGECESVDAPDARSPETLEAPTEPLDDGTTYALSSVMRGF